MRTSRSPFGALCEVLVAFAAMHVGFRAFQRFTPLGRDEVAAGLNYAPGVAMILVSLAAILVARRRLADCGLTWSDFAGNVRVGLVALVLVFAAGAALYPLDLERVPASIGRHDALIYVGASIVVIGVLLVLLARGFDAKLPRTGSVVIALAAIALPLVATLWTGRDLERVALTVGWVVLGAGIGEEVFFRGYVQSRLNEALGRPFEAWGVRFGLGLILASLLFGLVHALNPTDYFDGHWSFRPWHGLVAAFAPYGFLREKTGSVVAPAALHVLFDLALRMPGLVT